MSGKSSVTSQFPLQTSLSQMHTCSTQHMTHGYTVDSNTWETVNHLHVKSLLNQAAGDCVTSSTACHTFSLVVNKTMKQLIQCLLSASARQAGDFVTSSTATVTLLLSLQERKKKHGMACTVSLKPTVTN